MNHKSATLTNLRILYLLISNGQINYQGWNNCSSCLVIVCTLVLIRMRLNLFDVVPSHTALYIPSDRDNRYFMYIKTVHYMVVFASV